MMHIDPELNEQIMLTREQVGYVMLVIVVVGSAFVFLISEWLIERKYPTPRHKLRASPHPFVRPGKRWEKP